jgi:hypothetical protein
MKFTFQWFLALILGISTIFGLVQHAYTPGSTVVATAMFYAFAPMVAALVLRSLWVPTQEMYGAMTVFCMFTLMSVLYQNAIKSCP